MWAFGLSRSAVGHPWVLIHGGRPAGTLQRHCAPRVALRLLNELEVMPGWVTTECQEPSHDMGCLYTPGRKVRVKVHLREPPRSN